MVTVGEDKTYGCVSAFGPNLDWTQYTDTAIANQLLGAVRKELEELFEGVVTGFTWSEQGMQPRTPRSGWNFDVSIKPTKETDAKEESQELVHAD